MASNQTQNYGLNQWEAADQVLRTDFNADNSKIDAALKTLSTQVSGKAAQSTVNSLSGQLSQEIQDRQSAVTAEAGARQAADNTEKAAREAADSALSAALALKGNCKVYFTSYAGNGATSHSHTFPSQPLAVLISGPRFQFTTLRGTEIAYPMEGGNLWKAALAWDDLTLTITYDSSSGGGDYKVGNTAGSVYYLLALMDAEE